jgi:hypothetical protein
MGDEIVPFWKLAKVMGETRTDEERDPLAVEVSDETRTIEEPLVKVGHDHKDYLVRRLTASVYDGKMDCPPMSTDELTSARISATDWSWTKPMSRPVVECSSGSARFV